MGFPWRIPVVWTSGKLGAKKRGSHMNRVMPTSQELHLEGLEGESRKTHKSTQKMIQIQIYARPQNIYPFTSTSVKKSRTLCTSFPLLSA